MDIDTKDIYIIVTLLFFLVILRSYIYGYSKPINKYRQNLKVKRFYDR